MSKDIPIIFSAPMVLALLDGRKTMTRRLAWRLPRVSPDFPGKPSSWQQVKPGDRLWVRETWTPHASGVDYAADIHAAQRAQAGPWRSPIHCPRSASRLTLIVTATRIERLQDITEADAIAEGIARNPVQNNTNWIAYPEGSSACGYTRAWDSFRSLWVDLHGAASWVDNPEVVALTFTVHKQNIDTLPKMEAA